MSWPAVHSELYTVAKLRQGFSIARFGDGEMKLADGAGYVREPVNEELGAELREIMANPDPRCIVGIPTFDSSSPKFKNWVRHKQRFLRLLNPDMEYYSAFISRPDSAPWIRTKAFAQLMGSLWQDKRAAVVCERKGSAFRAVKSTAKKASHIECPSEKAYAIIDALEQAVLDAKPEIAILSVGPTASCLANRLASRGIQAIDIGSGGKFIAELLK